MPSIHSAAPRPAKEVELKRIVRNAVVPSNVVSAKMADSRDVGMALIVEIAIGKVRGNKSDASNIAI
jgi:hypothetical protein